MEKNKNTKQILRDPPGEKKKFFWVLLVFVLIIGIWIGVQGANQGVLTLATSAQGLTDQDGNIKVRVRAIDAANVNETLYTIDQTATVSDGQLKLRWQIPGTAKKKAAYIEVCALDKKAGPSSTVKKACIEQGSDVAYNKVSCPYYVPANSTGFSGQLNGWNKLDDSQKVGCSDDRSFGKVSSMGALASAQSPSIQVDGGGVLVAENGKIETKDVEQFVKDALSGSGGTVVQVTGDPTPGPQGVAGANGVNGTNGVDGADGAVGVATVSGGGLILTGQNLSLDDSCLGGQILQWDGSTWACASVAGTDSQTLSLAANVLAISGGNSVNLSGYLDNTDSQALSWNGGTRTLSLTSGGSVVISDSDTTYGAGNGLSLGGTTFSINSPTCAGTTKLTWNGTVFSCAADVDTDTDTTNFNVAANGGAGQNISAGGTVNFTNGTGTTASRSGSDISFGLANTAVTGGTYSASNNANGSLALPQFTVDAQGRLTAASTSNVTLTGIANSQLANSAITVNTAGPLAGGGSVSLGGSLNLSLDLSDAGDSATATTSSGSGLEISGNEVGLLRGCSSNQLLKWNSGSLRWECATDTDTDTNSGGTVTSITAGTGLSGGAITTSGTIDIANTGVTAATYGSSTSIPVITVNAQGQITAASSSAIPTADTSTTGLLTDTDWDTFNGKENVLTFNGNGLFSRSGNTVTGLACSAGQIPKWTAGTFVCGADDNSGSAYTAGNGLSLSVNSFSINSPTCAGTDKLTWNGTAFSCASDVDTDTDTTYNAGTGLGLSGTTFNLANTAVTAASYAPSNNANGSLALPQFTVDAQGRLTAASTTNVTLTGIANSQLTNSAITVNTAGGLTGGSSVSLGGSINLSLDLSDAGDTATATTNSGSGLEVSGGEIGLIRGCSSSQLLKWNSSSLRWECATDTDTDTNSGGTVTSITAGTGLSGGTITTSGTIDIAATGVTAASYGSSTSIPVITVNAQGQITAASSSAIPTATTSTTGLLTDTDWDTFNGKENVLTFNGNGLFSRSGNTVTGLACTGSQIPKWNAGAFACGTDVDTDTDTTYSAGNGLSLGGTTFSINSPTCAGTDKLTWSGTAFSCASDVDTDTDTTNFNVAAAGTGGSQNISSGGTVTFGNGTGTTATRSGSTVTYDLNNTAVSAGSYAPSDNANGSLALPQFTVDAQGRLTAASTTNVSLTGIANSQLANSAITVNTAGGLTGGSSVSLGGSINLSLDLSDAGDSATASTNSGSGLEVSGGEIGLIRGCSNTQLLKWNSSSLRWECASDTDTNSGGTVTSVTAGTGLSGGTITSTGTIDIANTGVTAASYGSSTSIPVITVNAQGQITAASSSAIPTADTSTTGLLTDTDWDTFNGKENVLTFNGNGLFSRSGNTVTGLACIAGEIPKWTAGVFACGVDSGGSSYVAGNGLSLGGSTFSINSPTCAGTDKLQWTGTAFICSADVDTDTGVTSIGTIDSQTKSANGAVISGTSLVLQTADGTSPGLVSTTTQTFAGDKTFSGSVNANGDVTLGDAAADGITITGEIRGASPLAFEGATNDGVYTTFAITDPTGARTITFPDASGTVCLQGSASCGFISVTLNDGQILIGNGSNVATAVTPSGDVTISNSGVTTIGANSVALGTDTTGNYVAGNTAGNGISVSGSAGEGWSPTIAINAPTCAGTDKLTWSGSAFSCAADVDTDTDTTYSAGTGLGLSGTTFNLANTAVTAAAYSPSDNANGSLALPQFTVDAQGRLTAASTTNVTLTGIANSQLTNSAITVNTAGGLTGGSSVSLGGSINLSLDLSDAGDANTATTSSGSGLEVSGGEIGLIRGCSTGQLLKYNSTTSLWECAADTDTNSGGTVTSITAGTGLSGGTITTSGTIDIANTGVTAATYGSGTSVPVITINAQGQITAASSAAIPTADTSTTGLLTSTDWNTFNGKENVLTFNGNGLFSRSGNTVTGLACTSGQIPKWTGSAFACGSDTDTDTDTTYSAGNGLSLGGTTFAINSPTCAGTDKLTWSGTAFSCATDVDTNTTYSAGTGLGLSGTTFNLANTAVSAGTYSPSDNADGSLSLPQITVDAQGRLTAASTANVTLTGIDNSQLANSAITVNTAGGLSGGAAVSLGGSLSLSIDLSDSGDANTATTSSGSGLETSSGEIGLLRGCATGELLKYNSTTSLWACATDTDTNSGGTVTSITAGTGLSGGTITTSGTIDIANTGVTAATYGSGTSVPVITINAQGQITAASSAAIPTADTSTTGLLTSTDWNTFNGKENVLTFTGNGLFSRSGNTVTGLACSTGEIPKWSGGTFTCGTDIDTDTDTTYSAGNGLSLASTTFSINSPTCAGTDKLTWSGTAFSCAADVDTDTGVTSVGTIDSQTKSANGAVISGTSLVLQTADGTSPGLVSTTTQTFAGDKTFSGSVNANGDVTLGDSAADGITITGEIRGASPLAFEGTTNDGVYTTFAITDPTLARTITFPDRSGTVSLSGDTFTGDVTGTLDASGATALTIAVNSVALGTDTTGDYVAGNTAGNGIAITGSTGEGWSPTVSINAPTCAGTDKLQWNGTAFVCTADVDTDTGVTTVGAFSGSSIADGASISGNTITFGPADGTNPGMVTTGTQTLAGAKTFTSGTTVRLNSASAFVVEDSSNVNVLTVSTNGGNKAVTVGAGGIDSTFNVVDTSSTAVFSVSTVFSDLYSTLDTYTFADGSGVTMISADGSTGNVGIGLDVGLANYKFDVDGDINTSSIYRVGGVAGATTTCSGGQVLQNLVAIGGIVTAGTCAADAGVVSIGTLDSLTKSANGAVISGTTLVLQTADATMPGLVSTGTQTFAGDKTFTGGLTATSTALFQNASNSTAAFQIQNAAGTSNLLIADTTNSRIGIGASPATSLLTIGTNTTTAAGGLTFGTDTNLYRSATDTLRTDDNLLVRTTTDSINAFRVQDSSGNSLLRVNTSSKLVNVAGVLNVNASFYSGVMEGSDYPSAGDCVDIYVKAGIAYVLCDDALYIYNVSVPASPVLLGSIATGSTPTALYVQGNYAYVTHRGGTDALQVFNIADPTNPVLAGSKATGSDPVSIDIQGKYAYVLNETSETLQVFDISTTTPVSVASGATGNTPRTVKVQDSYAYVTNTGDDTLQIIDVSSFPTLSTTGSVAVAGTGNAYALDVQGQYAYVTGTYWGTLESIDISDPASPSLVSATGSTVRGGSIKVYGRYAYVSDNSGFGNDVNVVSISNPSAMVPTGSYVNSGYANNIFIENGFAYTAVWGGLESWDLESSNMHQLRVAGLTTGTVTSLGNANFNKDVTIDGGLSVSGSSQFRGDITGTGTVNFQNASDSTNALQVANSAGEQIVNVDTATNTNLITNSSFEVNTTGWAGKGGGSITQNTSHQYSGNASAVVSTAFTYNRGTSYSYALASSTTYTFSGHVKSNSGSSLSINMGYSEDGSTDTICTNVNTPNNTAWSRFTCTFTTGTTSGSPYVYVTRSSGGLVSGFYLDGVTLKAESVASPFGIGGLSFNGVITSPIALKNQSDSDTAFTVQSADNTGLLQVNTRTKDVIIGGDDPLSPFVSFDVDNRYAIIDAGGIGGFYAWDSINGSGINYDGGSEYFGANVNNFTITDTSGAVQGISFDGTTGNVGVGLGIGAANYTFDVDGDINISSGSVYRYNGTAGTTTTCSGGQILLNPVLQGGITTAGTCTSGAVTSIGTIDSQTKSANGAVISGNNLILQTADASFPGLVSTGTQSFAGNKTFTGNVITNGSLQVDGSTVLGDAATDTITANGSMIANATATGTTDTTSGTGTNTTTVTIAGTAFANNDVILIDNAGQDYYTRVVSGGGTSTLTVLPAVSFDNAVTVTKYNIQNIGATDSDYTTASDRFFQGYFLGGVVAGAGTTTLSDGRLAATTGLNFDAPSYTFTNTSDSTNAFRVNKANGESLVKFDTATTENLLSNGNFEANTTGWAAHGSSTVTQTGSQYYLGTGSMSVATTAAANDGAKFNYALASQTNYTMTFYVKMASLTATNSTVAIGYSQDGSTDTDCTTSTNTLSGGGWTKVTCNFTTADVSGTDYIYIKQTDAVARTIYVDSVQLESVSSYNSNTDFESGLTDWGPYSAATLSQTSSQAYTGSNSLQIDTSTFSAGQEGGVINVGTVQPNTTYNASFMVRLDGATAASKSFSLLKRFDTNDGVTNTCTTKTITADTWTNISCTFTTGQVTSASPYIGVTTLDAGDFSTVYTFYIDNAVVAPVKWSSNDIGRISLNGSIDSPLTVRGAQDSTSALQVQQQNGKNVLTVDTLNGRVGINTDTPTRELEVSGKALFKATDFNTNTLEVQGSTGLTAFNVVGSTRAVSVGANSGTLNASLSTYGTGLFKTMNTAGSASAFSVQDSANANVLTVSTSTGNKLVYVGEGGIDAKFRVINTSSTPILDIDSAGGGYFGAAFDDFQVYASSGGAMIISDGVGNTVTIGDADDSSSANTSLFVVDSASTANLPTGINGGIVYDSQVDKFKIFEGGAYKTLCNTTDLGCAATAVTTVGAFSGSSIANGASISGSTITFGPADGTNPGMVTTGTQTLAGAKTFSSAGVFDQGLTVNNSQLKVRNLGGGFLVQDTFNVDLFSVDTSSNKTVTIGSAATHGLTINSEIRGASPLIFEGATNDDTYTTFAITDPTSARTITFPDRSGTVSLSGDTFTGDVTGTLNSSGATGLTIAADAVALGTDTTGNYVAGNTAGNGIAITGSAGEGWSPTVSISAPTCSGTDKLQWNGTAFVCSADTDTGVTTVGAFSGSSIANGASISGTTITFGPADGTNPGMVTTGTQTIAGAKTFTGTTTIGSAANNQLVITPGWSAGNGVWIDLNTSGPSGIGTGGPGANPFLAYAAGSGQWFSDALAGDTAYRNTSGRILLGNTGGNAQIVIDGSETTFNTDVVNSGNLDITTITGGGLTDCNGTNNRLTWSSSTSTFGCDTLSANSFVDTTADAVADNNTTNYWDLAVENGNSYPIITPSTTSREIFGTVTMEVQGTTTSDVEVTARIERNIGSAPTCNSSTDIGAKPGTFSSNINARKSSTVTFTDTPATTSAVYYTLCADTDTVGTAANITRIRFTLFEVNNSADLAEVYATNDPNLKVGDVVSMDEALNAGVKKTQKAYSSDILGVVSTDPAIVIGGTNGEGSGGAAVALSGRVPVKVNTENGAIEPGDLLTSSSTPGVAMKATKAGAVVGQAMGGYDGDGIGTVNMFVKTGYGNGSLKGLKLDSGENAEQALGTSILSQLMTNSDSIIETQDISNIVTDRLVANTDIITPSLTANNVQLNSLQSASGEPIQINSDVVIDGTLTVDKIRANQIEGLDVYVQRLSSLDDLQTSGDPQDTENNADILSRIVALEETVDDLDQYKEVLSIEAIGESSASKAIILSDAQFKKQVEFLAAANFRSDVNVDGTFKTSRLIVTNNTGNITLQPGQTEVQVFFLRPLGSQPNVFISTENPEVKVVAQQRSATGFTVKLAQPLTEPLEVQWFAVEKE